MLFSSRLFCGTLVLAIVPATTSLSAQEPAPRAAIATSLPDAPQPQVVVSALQEPQSPPAQTSSPSNSPQQGSSSSQAPATDSDPNNTQREKAEQEIKEQEHQRIFGVLPSFNTTYRGDAVTLSAKEKMSLAFHSAVDPVTFATAFVVAGYREALDDDTGFGWGIEGYGKRSGAAYLDAFDGTMIGNGILPALLHQDPRYFRLGHGTKKHRLLYAAATSVICKHDNTRKWEPNYSNVLGNIASGALSNFYYPSEDSGFGETIENGMIVTAEGTLGAVFNEFWPDISRKLFHKDPTHGLDAQAAAADAAGQKTKQPVKPEK